jgi:hypothetical protein
MYCPFHRVHAITSKIVWLNYDARFVAKQLRAGGGLCGFTRLLLAMAAIRTAMGSHPVHHLLIQAK